MMVINAFLIEKLRKSGKATFYLLDTFDQV